MAKRKMVEDVARISRRVDAADKATSHGVTESRTRQTYYVPEELHRELKVAAITRGVKVSDLVCEGIQRVLKSL